MRIENRTNYRTADLRAIVAKVAADELADHPDKRKRLAVEIIHCRTRTSVSGVAWRHGCRVRLRVPKLKVDPILFAWLAAHELAHVRGMGHRKMPASLNNYTAASRERWAWAAAFPIRPAAHPVEKSPLTALQARRDHAAAMLRKADTRMKRAETIRLKWARRLRDANRKLALAEGATADTSTWGGRPVPAELAPAAGRGEPDGK
jgi:hypothetical protein